ncbi:hypothetical protein R5R35_009348 [Gryllus longicercus]|uniref:Uncharacterized protein n=1 Tax=Gryllus longicercus TaxID=2509291 RepID=A0AAN9VAU6_9ORTH
MCGRTGRRSGKRARERAGARTDVWPYRRVRWAGERASERARGRERARRVHRRTPPMAGARARRGERREAATSGCRSSRWRRRDGQRRGRPVEGGGGSTESNKRNMRAANSNRGHSSRKRSLSGTGTRNAR